MFIRIRDSGVVVTEDSFRALFPGTSFPQILAPEILDSFGADPVFEGPHPSLTEDQYSVYVGVELIGGYFFTRWEARDMSEEQKAHRLAEKRNTMVVSPFQAKAALLNAGLLDDVEAIIASPDTDRMVVLAWANALEYKRLSPMVASIASSLGWSDSQLDELFIQAAIITA